MALVSAPTEFQGDIMGSINQRRGMITNNSTDGAQSVINADVPSRSSLRYSTDILFTNARQRRVHDGA